MIPLAAPTKFEPLSLQMVMGIPLLGMNLRNMAMRAEVVSSATVSRYTAYTEIHTKTATYPFVMMGLHSDPVLI